MTSYDRSTATSQLARRRDLPTAPAGLLPGDRAASHARQRPGWLVALRGGTTTTPIADTRSAIVLAVLLALLLLSTLAAVVGGRVIRHEWPFGPTNGAIAFQRGNDPGPYRLFAGCGDPATASELVVPGVTSVGLAGLVAGRQPDRVQRDEQPRGQRHRGALGHLHDRS